MTDQPQTHRTDEARRTDDHDLIEGAERAPSAQGTSGGTVAADIASRDEEKRALDPDAGITNVQKSDTVQPAIPTRADNEGANG
ncbi:hypothetical protein [uncultured Sphingomonas sp.]|uniref:hypothetical protein n=1 Tax=uncultured Sphingomonas sp. TaxID=158754 RepID=UPI0025E56D5E|nr:hypothetical protein [uncultured Sphingomonas sp.]